MPPIQTNKNKTMKAAIFAVAVITLAGCDDGQTGYSPDYQILSDGHPVITVHGLDVCAAVVEALNADSNDSYRYQCVKVG